MRIFPTILLVFALAACGQAAAPSNADAQTTAPGAASASGEATAAERAAILAALHLSADRSGQVMNECGDRVAPTYSPADVGLGRTILFGMGGGPIGGYTCYGDGPDLHLMKSEGAAWRDIYSTRGGFMVILPTKHNGANDLAFGGPGMTHSTSRWTGTTYGAGPEIDDSAISGGVTLPQQ